jgi:GrpB protein
MSHIRVLICRVDDPSADQMTELAAFDPPEADILALQPDTALDALETIIYTTGNAILRRLLQAQWDTIDAQLTAQYRDWLRTHADDRLLYEQTKRDLAARAWKYTQNYADAKSAVVQEIVARARRNHV